tara:strand:- start:2062 stop:3123 length:1062 start_codon:yes stop_codon:yes gene_type:complete
MSNLKYFKKAKYLPVDNFFNNVLYDKNFGYYNLKQPIGKKGDFITAPKISYLFSEMIALWIISTWELFGKPKHINIIELGPGDGSLSKVLVQVFEKFPQFNNAKKIFLYEKSNILKKFQKKKLNNSKIRWINNFSDIKKGPVIFFGNEFLDAIPIKQFKREGKLLYEKNFIIKSTNKIDEIFKIASKEDTKIINSFKTLKKLKFIEFPKMGFIELKKILKKILNSKGCILLIDYGYMSSNNQNTLQSVMKHKKNNLFSNLGKADVTSHINFSLLEEFFLKNNLKVKKVISQKEFLERMGIIQRAEIISKKIKFIEQSNLFFRLKRLLSPKLMGNLFKVILAFKFDNDNYFGFK